MGKKKKKHNGHYCRICGEHKANEKFSGKGHATHICKKCHALPVSTRNDLVRIRKIERAEESFLLAKDTIKLLKKYVGDTRYPESSQYAKNVLDGFYQRMDEYNNKFEVEDVSNPILFSELDDDQKQVVIFTLEQFLIDFIEDSGYIPEKTEISEIIDSFCKEMDWEYDSPAEQILIPDDELCSISQAVLDKILSDYQADGIEIPTFLQSITMVETERLSLRLILPSDYVSLYAIMKKPEVMYAWEHGFTKGEVKAWIGKQRKLYHRDGHGYFAVILKESGKLIGQAGFFNAQIDGEEVTELGYIFDDEVWGNGYAYEAAKVCIQYAKNGFGIDTLYCSIRPENTASISLAMRLGFHEVGQMTIVYKDKNMLHTIYRFDGDNNCSG